MPSRLHEDLLRLFQNRPALAAEVAREALHARLPEYAEARIDSANLSDLRPAEYRADLVVLLLRDEPVHGIVVEVQLGRDEGVACWASRLIEMYGDMLFAALSEAASKALQTMNPAKYEYQSEFAKRYYGQGLTEGQAKGRAELVLRLLALRFGPLPEAVQARIHETGIKELDRIGERLLTAGSLSEALDPR